LLAKERSMTRGNLLARLLLIAVLSSMFLVVSAQAQFRGGLRGTVTDPQGEVVVGATVTLVDTDTNKTLVSTSDANGIYEFNALPAAPYRLTVEHEGFEKKLLAHVVIISDQPNALDLQLTVGQVQTTVTVSETTQTLDTETATLSGTITSNQIQNMPSFGRDVFQLIQLTPGVFGDGAQGGNGGGENIPGSQGPGATGGGQGIFQTENGPQALAHGGQYENNGISIDGISTASAVWGGTTVITPSEESVESVKVVSNGYDAENGRFNGAQIAVTSKSGSNQFHGSGFFSSHRPNLNAYQRFNGAGNSTTRDDNFDDQFGGSVGGPIWKNKIFFFFAYETVRTPASVPTIGNGWYDTAAFDKLAPAGSIASTFLTFPGSGVVNQGINNSTCANAGLVEGTNCITIPGQGLNIGTPLNPALFPTGEIMAGQDPGWLSAANPGTGGDGSGGPENLDPTTADIANFQTVSNSTSSKAQYNGRLDANITPKDSVTFAIYWVPQSTSFLNGPAREYNFFHHSQINDAFSLIWNHTISPSFLNEARVNAAGWRWNEVASNPQSPVGLPADTIGSIGSIQPQAFGPSVGNIFSQWTYTYKDVATKIIGRHTIKFGGDVTRLFYLQECPGCAVPNYNFFNMWDFLNDAPRQEGGNFSPTTGAPTTIRQDDRTNLWGFFAQDDFKLRRNLTINLGLRYSYFSPLSSKEGNMFVATPGAGSAFLTGLTVHKGDSWNAQKDNLGPQIGFAWSPGQFHDKIVVRGGYGLNYNQEELAISSGIVNNPGLAVAPTFSMAAANSPNPGIVYGISSNLHSLNSYPPNPNAVSTFGPNGLPTTGTVNISLYPTNLPTMLTHHYSFDIQNDLGHNWIMSVGYLGSLSRNIFFHQSPNATPAAQGFALNPQIGGGDYWAVNGSGNYNALLGEIKHQFSQQFMSDAQFSWSKSLDDASSPYSSGTPPYSEPFYPYKPSLNYGPSDYNVTKAFKLYGMWQPVFFRGSRGWLEKVAGGWSLSGIFNWHSGFPWGPYVNVVNGNLYCDTCGYGALPAIYLGGAGNSTSNDQFKTGSNYPLAATQGNALAYFAAPAYTAYNGTTTPAYGNANPQVAHRNIFVGPGYRDVDMTLAKSFGLPKAPVLGEGAKLELRVDAYNLFNILNLNPTSIANNVGTSNFGQAQSALAARVLALTARFSF
jgi:Carboxypeptidase regulatory-like domain